MGVVRGRGCRGGRGLDLMLFSLLRLLDPSLPPAPTSPPPRCRPGLAEYPQGYLLLLLLVAFPKDPYGCRCPSRLCIIVLQHDTSHSKSQKAGRGGAGRPFPCSIRPLENER